MQRVSVIGALLLIAGLNPSPQAVPATLRDLAWIAGRWVGEEGGGLSEEIWSAPAGDSMIGMWRWVEGGRLRLYESLALVETGDGVVMRLRHLAADGASREDKQRPVNLRLVAGGDRRAVFEGAEPQATVRLSYELTAPDSLRVVLEKQAPGQAPKSESFVLVRRP
jgi:hypothetical protein